VASIARAPAGPTVTSVGPVPTVSVRPVTVIHAADLPRSFQLYSRHVAMQDLGQVPARTHTGPFPTRGALSAYEY
jgi:hypothetical protein